MFRIQPKGGNLARNLKFIEAKSKKDHDEIKATKPSEDGYRSTTELQALRPDRIRTGDTWSRIGIRDRDKKSHAENGMNMILRPVDGVMPTFVARNHGWRKREELAELSPVARRPGFEPGRTDLRSAALPGILSASTRLNKTSTTKVP